MMTNKTPHLTLIARMLGERLTDIGGSKRGAVRLFLHQYAGGRCFTCGQDTFLDATPDMPWRAEVGHVVSVGNSKVGIKAGCVGNQCRACNLEAQDADMREWLGETNWAMIPTEWPSWSALMAAYRESKCESAAMIEHRARSVAAMTRLKSGK